MAPIAAEVDEKKVHVEDGEVVHPESFERLRRDLIRQALGTKAQRARALR